AHHHHERTRWVEPEGLQQHLVLGARTLVVEDVRLRPAGDDDPVGCDAVIADEVVPHDVVLHEVALQVRRDDPLADGVVPACDVPDCPKTEAARAGDERDDGVHLHVRKRDRGPLTLEAASQRRRDVARASVVPPLHDRVEKRPARQGPRERRIEEPVRVARLHALTVEAVAETVAQRERIEPDATVEPGVAAAKGPLADGSALRDQVAGPRRGDRAGSLGPRIGLLARVEQEELEAIAESVAEALDDPCVEEEPGGERIREDEPDGRHDRMRAPSTTAIRSASDAPSRPWNRRASAGVPHAGQPSTPKVVTVRPSSALRSVSASAPTGAWSSTTKMSPNGST